MKRGARAGLVAILAACCAGGGVAGAAGDLGVPEATSPPVISGDLVEGQTLAEGHAGWTNSPTSYAYQWEDCDGYGAACTAIPGATAQTYALAARDVGHTIRVRESAANAAGTSGFANSAATALVYAPGQQHQPPSSAAAPALSGAPYVGGKVQSTPGAWASLSRVSYAYQWQRCRASCDTIPKATNPWYTATPADQGARLRVVVTASNAFGRGRAASGLTAAVGPPNTAIKRPLQHAVTPTGRGARLSAVRAAHGYSFRYSAVVPGQLEVQWYYLPKGTRLGQAYGKVLPVLVATASTRITRPRQVKMKLRLTRAGGPLLASMSLVKLTAKGSFTPPGRPTVVVIARFAISG
ncbi:MAG: hypothetical protein ABSG43_25165 [Solirubrobacteraceae bacterium]